MSITATVFATLTSTELIAKLLEPLASKIGAKVVDKAQEKWGSYKNSFDRYLKEAEGRHKYFSSQVFANEGQLLEDYYIPLTLVKNSSATQNVSVMVTDYPTDLLAAYKDVLVVDTAGMGKSTLLKFIFLRSISSGSAIPIFVELRKLSREKALMSFLIEELRFTGDKTSIRMLEESISQGVFTFFLDGFDEIPEDEKPAVSAQILELKKSGPKNRFILSSREEQSLAYLAEFHKFNIKPLSQEEAFCLIRRITRNEQLANKLIEKILAQPGHTLNEFLTNPLLVSLLVKSFMHSPILPVRLSEFYRQVFDALFQTHDATKELGGYARPKFSGLDLDRFHKVLRSLGALTYQDNKLEFSTDELLLQIERAKILTSEQDFSASNFHHDLLHAVPLFVRDGGKSRWAHRSLQEYFAAAYICIDAKEAQVQLLQQLYTAGLQKNSNILKLCADIDGKTFKLVVVKKYLQERLTIANSSFARQNFVDIDENLLAARRGFIFDARSVIYVLPPGTSADNIGVHAAKIFREASVSGGILATDISGKGVGPDPSARYLIAIRYNKYEAIDKIIHTYFGVDILMHSSFSPLNDELINIPYEQIIQINDNPTSPLNSKENFESFLNLLKNLSISDRNFYNIVAMEKLYDSITAAERESFHLGIRFS